MSLQTAQNCAGWAGVDAPEFSPFNANPEVLLDRVDNPERVLAAVPFIALAGQKADVGIVTNGMLCCVEHPGKLLLCVNHGFISRN